MDRSRSRSSAPPTRHRAGIQSRRALLDAAARLVEVGSDLAMADVAREAGLTRATVYRHFSDREAILNALVAGLADEVLPQLLEQINDAELGIAMDVIGQVVADCNSRHRHLVEATASRWDKLARQGVPEEPIQDYLRSRRKLGELDVPQSDAFLSAAIRALCLAAVNDLREANEVANDLSQTLRRLVGAPAAHGRPTDAEIS